MRKALAIAVLSSALGSLSLADEPPAPIVACDFAKEADVAAGEPILAWMKRRGPDWGAEFGTPSFFSIRDGALRLVAKPGPLSKSWNPMNLTKREDKVILRVRGKPGTDLRAPVARFPKVEVTVAPVRLPGKGADVTDSKRNDACFYLLVGFDGPTHDYHGTALPDTVAYVWTDAPLKAEVGREPKYEAFMRYIAIGSGLEKPGEIRTIARDLASDFRKAFPERAKDEKVPDVVRIGLMIDSNTVGSEAESMLKSVRLLPAAEDVH